MHPTPASGLSRLFLTAVLGALVVAGVLWLQAFVAGVSVQGLTAPPDASLTQAYTVALAKGQAHLERTPDPRLLALTNPYDPAANAGLGLLDVSLYAGRYYLYFGVVPWAVLLVPWFKLTGTHLSDGAVLWLFCGFGFSCYALALWEIWRRWFAQVSPVVLVTAWAVLAVASGSWALLAIPQMTQVPSAGAYACCALAWLALVFAETSPASRNRWLALAMLAAGLVMGCRPNYLPLVALMVGWTVFKLWSHRPATLGKSIAVLLPIVLVGALLAGWNYARFGNPLEFGFRYQLIALNRAAGEGEMSWHHLVFNLHRYLLGGARLVEYFPFIAGELPGPFPLPAGHDATDQVYGVLWIAPIVLLAPFAILSGPKPLRPLVMLIVAGGLGNLLLLGAFGGGAYRYPVDFMAALALSAATGLLAIASSSSRTSRSLGLGLGGGILAWSAAAGLCQLVSFYDLFARNHPVAFKRVAAPFNALVYYRQNLRKDGPRALRLTVKFPTGRAGQVEPLVVLGPQSQQDFLYVYYPAPGKAQFGFEAIGRGGPVSREVSLDFSRSHTLELRYGCFQPPDDHPAWRELAQADRDLARRSLTVLLDDQPVLDGWADFHPPRGVQFVGKSPYDAAFGRQFTGEIERIESPPLPPLSPTARWEADRYGALRVNLTLRPAPAGSREPLLTLGHRNQGAVLVLERLSGNQVRLGYFPAGAQEVWSLPFPWPTDQPKILGLETGALFPPVTSTLWPVSLTAADRSAAKRLLECRLDNQVVWMADVPPLDVSPTTVTLARNDLLLAGIAPTLAAEMSSLERRPWSGLIGTDAAFARASESDPKNADRTSSRQ